MLLSQQPAPACSLGQLAFDYHGVQYGTGNAFSDLDVRDIAATPCTLTGPISVVGIDAGGRAVTNRLSLPVAGDLILTAHAAPRALDGSTAQRCGDGMDPDLRPTSETALMRTVRAQTIS